jgi:hypothetical protein
MKLKTDVLYRSFRLPDGVTEVRISARLTHRPTKPGLRAHRSVGPTEVPKENDT